MKKNVITNEITLEKFGFFAGIGTYVLKTNSGDVIIEITDKKSNFGSGNLTVYSAVIDGQVITDKPIGFYKKMFGAVVNHRDTTALNSAKVLSDSEISGKVATYKINVENAIAKVAKLLSFIGLDETETNETLSAAIPSDYVSIYREILLANNAKAKEANEKAEQAKKEREKKAEKREIAKSVTEMSDIQAELVKAILANDFAKVAELTAKIQSA